jgi:hypothetical protein
MRYADRYLERVMRAAAVSRDSPVVRHAATKGKVMKRKLAVAVVAVIVTLAAAVGAGWKWGSHSATGKAEPVAGWTWDGATLDQGA